MSSNYEGFPRTAVEAMASKCPIITTDMGCVDELLFNQKNCWVSPINSSDGLAESIIDAFKNNEKRLQFIRRASEDLKKLLTKDETLELMKKSWEITFQKHLHE